MAKSTFSLMLSCLVLLLSISISYLLTINYSTDSMATNGILFVSNAAKAHKLCSKVSKFVKDVLYINFNSGPESTRSILSKQIVDIYTKNGNLDVRLMLKARNSVNKIYTSKTIQCVIYEKELTKDIDNLKKSLENVQSECPIHCVDDESLTNPIQVTQEDVQTYDYVVLGGTFDRLHNGHKILLSQAVLRSTKHVTVGVTGVNMIQSKTLWELIEPVEDRIKNVIHFLKDINPDLEYNVIPLQDMYGPTKDDPRYQLVLASEETLFGAHKINEKRKENGLQPLDIYTIGVAEDLNKQSQEEEGKVSSTNQRMRLLGTVLREPKPNPNIPDWPYVIGLAGGIASGKSKITEKLRLKGAAIVNCDIIAHELYKPGLPLNQSIAEEFGKHVITKNGEVDRKILGSIVFGDKEQLLKLNKLVWPAVIEEAQRRVKAFGELGYRVVVMEAAVMVQAKWYKNCHQLWTVIVPPKEAIKRLQERNSLSEEEAKQRIESQPTNLEQVSVANVVFSPFWSYEYTQQQLDRAWDQLQQYLDKRN